MVEQLPSTVKAILGICMKNAELRTAYAQLLTRHSLADVEKVLFDICAKQYGEIQVDDGTRIIDWKATEMSHRSGGNLRFVILEMTSNLTRSVSVYITVTELVKALPQDNSILAGVL